jgi:hypothetical protein
MAMDAAGQPAEDHQPELRLIDAIVDGVLDRLGDAVVLERILEAARAAGLLPLPPNAARWLDANQVAQRLNHERDWVYAHAEELGVRRIGKGSRPRLRFPPDVADSKNERPDDGPPAKPKKPTGLIPIRGQ